MSDFREDTSIETNEKDNDCIIAPRDLISEVKDLKNQIAQSFSESNKTEIEIDDLKIEITNLKIQIRQLTENARLTAELQKIETNNFVENDKAATALRKIQIDLLKSEVDKLVELVKSQTGEMENLKKEVVAKFPLLTTQKTESGNNTEKIEDTRSEQSRREDTESISSKFSTSSSKKKQFNLHYRFANAKNTEEHSVDKSRERSQKRRGFREVVIKEPEPISAPDKNQYDAKRKIAAASYLPSKRVHTRG